MAPERLRSNTLVRSNEWHSVCRDLNSVAPEHCIDTIRQSLQCSADISPVLYHWDGYVGEVKGDARTVHTCRNFTKIQEWAAAHRVKQSMEIDI